MTKAEKALQKAIAIAGTNAALGALCGITGQAVAQWKQVPRKHILTVERHTGISRHELRPDIFGSRP